MHQQYPERTGGTGDSGCLALCSSLSLSICPRTSPMDTAPRSSASCDSKGTDVDTKTVPARGVPELDVYARRGPHGESYSPFIFQSQTNIADRNKTNQRHTEKGCPSVPLTDQGTPFRRKFTRSPQPVCKLIGVIAVYGTGAEVRFPVPSPFAFCPQQTDIAPV